MLYLGRDPQPSWDYAPLTEQGYADRDLYEYWAARDPIALYAARLEADGIISAGDLERFKREAEAARRRAGARGDRRAVAEAGAGRRRRVRERAAADTHRGAGSRGPAKAGRPARQDVGSRSSRADQRGVSGFSRTCVERRAAVRPEGPHAARRRHARRRRRAARRPARLSSTARTWAGATAMPSCCSGRS